MKPRIEARFFADDGRTPNNPDRPFVLMRGSSAIPANDRATWFEQCFREHGWGSTWRWTVYPYHHFHSTNHEVLGVSRGSATLMIGGESGGDFQVVPGDVLVIPAGVGHMRLESSDDFEVVGGYPGGIEPDLLKPGAGDLESIRARIGRLPLPHTDPLRGPGGPLFDHWQPVRALPSDEPWIQSASDA